MELYGYSLIGLIMTLAVVWVTNIIAGVSVEYRAMLCLYCQLRFRLG
jgi:hypothetical protein